MARCAKHQDAPQPRAPRDRRGDSRGVVAVRAEDLGVHRTLAEEPGGLRPSGRRDRHDRPAADRLARDHRLATRPRGVGGPRACEGRDALRPAVRQGSGGAGQGGRGRTSEGAARGWSGAACRILPMRRIAAVMAALAVLSGWSAAQGPPAAFPAERPLRLLTPYGAGGGIDIAARILSSIGPGSTSARGSTSMNMPGAGGLNAATFVRDADPDGYTLADQRLRARSSRCPLLENTPYGPTDWVPLVQVTEIAPTFVVRPGRRRIPRLRGSPPRRARQTRPAARDPRRLHELEPPAAAAGSSSSQALRTNHVPTLGGGETMQFLLASIVSLAVTNSSSIAGAVQRAPRGSRSPSRPPHGRLTCRRRPTLRELGFDVVMPVWYTIFAHVELCPRCASSRAVAERLARPPTPVTEATGDRQRAPGSRSIRSPSTRCSRSTTTR
jgi:tripartite-type tricarboxylate transporter receptor subunit TctC